jgi:hypothetical protein
MRASTRTIAALAIGVAGVCTTAMNWRFSYQLGTSTADSYTWAIFSVALDVAKWLMLPFAALAWPSYKPRAVAATAIWLVATIYSFTAAIGFAALNRATIVAEQEAQADRQKVLLLMRQSPRWQSSAACADVTTSASREFCARYRATEIQLKGAQLETDPQSALLAQITGLSVDTARLALCIFLAVACEVISALGFLAILPPAPPNQGQRAKPATWTPPKWTPAAKSKLPKSWTDGRAKHEERKNPR